MLSHKTVKQRKCLRFQSPLKLFLYFTLTGVLERNFTLEMCFKRGTFGLLEMYILLTDGIAELYVGGCGDGDFLDRTREQLFPAVDIKLPHKQHEDLFLSILMARCPVSREYPLIINPCKMVVQIALCDIPLFWIETSFIHSFIH